MIPAPNSLYDNLQGYELTVSGDNDINLVVREEGGSLFHPLVVRAEDRAKVCAFNRSDFLC